ncbi:hypothetical protein BC628DRAFT_1320827 [Trametes gibbosa]|nr:hypothetical protein BC628DRAFT_1320827 [Trametes gibbosa]
MPPDYELQSYWQKRFVDESHFEWLGDGKETILPHIRAYLLGQQSTSGGKSSTPARLLHIGAGTSSLSERLRELYIDVYGNDVDERQIVNADFVEELVEGKRKAEEVRAGNSLRKGMQWVCADALNWPDLHRLVESDSDLFDMVIEKSTSDAISCGEDVSFGQASTSAGLHPAFSKYLETHPEKVINFSPVEVFAIHLASLVRPGGLWVALTFSSNRFPFLSLSENCERMSPRGADYWSLERVVAADAPTGAQKDVHAPAVQHSVCLIRRKLSP